MGVKPFKNYNLDQQQPEFQFKRDKLSFFDKECLRIANHKNREVLRQNRITHLLNCVGFAYPEYFKSDLVYKKLWLQYIVELQRRLTTVDYLPFEFRALEVALEAVCTFLNS